MRILNRSWLVEWASYYNKTEVPGSFALWSGIWAISSILQNNVYMRMGPKKLYPNLYIMVIGPGASGKSLSAREAFKLVKETSLCETYDGEITKSYFVKYLDALGAKNAILNNQPQVKISMYSDELALTVGQGPQAADFLRAMTLLYDFSFTYGTHAHGQISVYDPVISWLSLTTPPWLRLSVPPDLVDSGFVARIIATKQELTQRSVPRLPQMDDILRNALLHDLIEMGKIQGEYYLSPAAEEYHDEWYDKNRALRLSINDDIVQGIYGREDEHAYKTAMVLMAARSDSLEITKLALENAIELVDRARSSNVELFRQLAMGVSRNGNYRRQ